ncbi:MAG: hypothetical protein MJZ30_08615 [Paludibacteraceae bacterium]|nr:hypothetical protein [Paludibacteraceae bacterium]
MKRFIYQVLLGASICMGGFCSQAYAETLEEDLNISDSRLYIREGGSYGKWLLLGVVQEKFAILSTGYGGKAYPLEIQAPQLTFTVPSSTGTMKGSISIETRSSGSSNHTTSYVDLVSQIGLCLKSVGYPIDFQGSQFTFSGGNMTVNGTITCKEELKVAEIETDKIRTKDIMADDVKVKMENAADYVFEEGYDLKPLNEVEAYVKRNKHLPGIPSAAEMSENGVSVSAMSNLLLEKVEELTLRMIEMEKKIKQLQEENDRLQQSVK